MKIKLFFTIQRNIDVNSFIRFQCVICALVLLSCGDIEVNPGPAAPSQSFGSSQFINFSVLNTRSVVHKAPSLHDIINDFQLDVIELTET